MNITFHFVMISIVSFVHNSTSEVNVTATSSGLRMEDHGTGQPDRVLSRRKRFLIFPDGSSFQIGRYIISQLEIFKARKDLRNYFCLWCECL